MNCKRFIYLLTFCLTAITSSAQLYKITGTVTDEATEKPLWGATVFVDKLGRGVAVSENGSYEIELAEGSYNFTFSFLGYERKVVTLVVDRSSTLDVKLSPSPEEIKEVVISGKRPDDNIQTTETGKISISKEELQKIPFLMGEIDPLRAIQLMPGVHTAGEGNTGFYVRGGAVDQNLILLDNNIVYNPSHLFGFFSVFNGSTVDNLELYKGGIPAYYGGRLSSITGITTRRGNTSTTKGEAGIGVLSTNVLLEGPIKKNEGSFLFAARRTYVDLFINPIREAFDVEEKLNYYFYDLNLNADYRLSKRDHLQFRAFTGKDKFSFGTGSSFSNAIRWQNVTGSIAWMHSFHEDFFSTTTVSTVLYDMSFGAGINNYNFGIYSDIRDHMFSYQLNWQKGAHTFDIGVQYTWHRLSPNNVEATTEDAELSFNNNVVLYADEASVFVNDQIKLSDKLEINAGLRFTTFSQLGPFTRFLTDESLQVLDTLHYSRGDRIATYANIEPRVSARYSLDGNTSLKFSYDRGYQYMHMAPLSSASLPMDVWVTSSTVVKPQYADQLSGGYFRNFLDNTLETSAVVYYKFMRNQLEYRDGVIIGYSKGFNYDDNFVFGEGQSYGLELMAKKNSGRINGMIGYTLSRTMRFFDELNEGKAFAAKYDRLHDLSIVANYERNKKWTFGGVFVYGTGNALNLPIARYVIQGSVVNEYGPRNAFRMPAYHRMDLSATYTLKKRGAFESSWIFSIYNVYNRRNPYYIYFETEGDLKEYSLKTSLKQVSLFPVLPSVTYRMKF